MSRRASQRRRWGDLLILLLMGAGVGTIVGLVLGDIRFGAFIGIILGGGFGLSLTLRRR
ncbi:hypothetical protein LM597_01175 [Candidatus Acetothermia bacterium]|jgi:hypothetical protein|nr:hypothetical protein [Candidatus Acetothermia bacterium]MCI2426028.1 hypothetical protein [Candidatus Acetothermia bacterium]MCI2427805.1 hypothetical protein [Candidatus Acetothermia bacterium]